ncbi:MAG: hypothetical protein JOZ96_04245 [Acidobacteria bacterium]|nr:hypothetical protein [Acidobacteriota bacterium]
MPENEPLNCPDCGTQMNHHADKPDRGAAAADDSPDAAEDFPVIEAHSCPACGRTATRPARG